MWGASRWALLARGDDEVAGWVLLPLLPGALVVNAALVSAPRVVSPASMDVVCEEE